MKLTNPQMQCLKAVLETRTKVEAHDPRFRLQTIAALMSRDLLEVTFIGKELIPMLVRMKESRAVYNLNKNISGTTYRDALTILHGAK